MVLGHSAKPDKPTETKGIQMPERNPRRIPRDNQQLDFNEKVDKIKHNIAIEVNASALTQDEKVQINKSVDLQIGRIKLNLEKNLKSIGENMESKKGREMAEQFLNKLREKYKVRLKNLHTDNGSTNEREAQKESNMNERKNERLYKNMFQERYSNSVNKVMKKYESAIARNAPDLLKRMGFSKEEIKDLKGINSKALLEALMRREIQDRNTPNKVKGSMLSRLLANAKNFKEKRSEDFQDKLAYTGMDPSIGDLQTRPSALAFSILKKIGVKDLSSDMKGKEILIKFHHYMQKNPDKDFKEVKNSGLKGGERDQLRIKVLVDKILGKGSDGVEGTLNAMINSIGNKPPEEKGIPVYIYVGENKQERRKIYLKNKKNYEISVKNPKTRNTYSITLNASQMKAAVLIAGYQGYGLSFASSDPIKGRDKKNKPIPYEEGAVIEPQKSMILSPKVLALVVPDKMKQINQLASNKSESNKT